MAVRFPAEIYSRYRPEYPSELFGLLRQWSGQIGLPSSVSIADIGCGTGQSTIGLVRSGFAHEIHAIEPDARMIAQAEMRAPLTSAKVKFINRPGEDTLLPSARFDVLTSMCAFHWMNREFAVREFLRLLKRPGLVFLAEYGFPIAANRTEFNGWIRGKLKGEWESPELRDRESFADMVSVFGKQAGVTSLGVQPVPMTLQLGWKQVTGLIQSQSRYTRFRDAILSDDERNWLDMETEKKTKELLGESPDSFDFRLLAAGFAVR